MKYLGLDVHLKATVWCLLDEQGAIVRHGQVETTFAGLSELVKELRETDELLVGQKVGTLCYFVHDVLTRLDVRVLSFNAHHLRMIASSRKKADKRDAFWIAKALQTGMTPHPVYLPTGEVRELRALLAQRDALKGERTRWRLRARRQLQGAGFMPAVGGASKLSKALEEALALPDGLPAHLSDSV